MERPFLEKTPKKIFFKPVLDRLLLESRSPEGGSGPASLRRDATSGGVAVHGCALCVVTALN